MVKYIFFSQDFRTGERMTGKKPCFPVGSLSTLLISGTLIWQVPVPCHTLQRPCFPRVPIELSFTSKAAKPPGDSAPGMLAPGCARHFHPDGAALGSCGHLACGGRQIPLCEPHTFFGPKHERFFPHFSGDGQ